MNTGNHNLGLTIHAHIWMNVFLLLYRHSLLCLCYSTEISLNWTVSWINVQMFWLCSMVIFISPVFGKFKSDIHTSQTPRAYVYNQGETYLSNIHLFVIIVGNASVTSDIYVCRHLSSESHSHRGPCDSLGLLESHGGRRERFWRCKTALQLKTRGQRC